MNVVDYLKYMIDVLPKDTLFVSSHTENTSACVSCGIGERSLLGFNMGFATPVGLGLALALPHRKVITLDGDGGVLLNCSALTDLASKSPSNLTVVINDNESYHGGFFPSLTGSCTDIAAMAHGAGIKNTSTVRTMEEFKSQFAGVLSKGEFAYIVAKTTKPMIDRSKPMNEDKVPHLWENKFNFVRYIEKSEKLTIIP